VVTVPEFRGLLCHGTTIDLDEVGGFDLSHCKEGGAMGRGFYFSNDIALGQQYSGGDLPIVAMITLENPYELDRDAVTYEERLAWGRMFRPNVDARERMIASGYDGVLFREGGYVEAVVFYPEQIESYGRMATFEDVESAFAP
jgi:hypothetical protein